jgi:hypothetical protein
MTEPQTRWRMPWGPVLTLALLAGGVTVRELSALPAEDGSRWNVVASAVLIVMSTFLVMNWLQNYFWGVVTALAMWLHPVYWHWAEPFGPALWANALELLLLSVTIAGWRLAYRPDFAWFGWLPLTAVGAAAMIAMPEDVHGVAWSTNVLVLLAFPALGTILSARQYWRGGNDRPSLANIFCTFTAGLLILVCSLAQTEGMWSQQQQFLASMTQFGLNLSHLFIAEWWNQWCWPNVWLAAPLMVWGLCRSVWRGWRQWKRRLPSTSWLLTLYTVLVWASLAMDPGDNTPNAVLPRASLAVLLMIFGIADVFRGISERIILLPPSERQE